eukprot:CAMPEP_0205830164 /NCGR_PEP_ID=MMETSP0206-20130828/40257_1 /ASSEMBLY_ACC=CAM_ASM_000279 /TAXON_ID=36767 /ORGANISM="Euplotes focardii, Strain TN1" /LENGTH=277 /DNA_ID=CAMNT_0053133553 /DNA_START=56 /DNA_END=889 /DNA_ORIENTATION=+
MPISSNERLFIKQGIEQNARNDGRTRMDYRVFQLTTGVIPNANGSARIKIGNTHVLVGVKVEIEKPDFARPDAGRVECSVDISAGAAPHFVADGARSLNTRLGSEMQRLLSDSGSLDMAALCVIPGRQCWVLYVDATVLGDGGNLLDAISLGAKAAMLTTLVPKVEVVEGERAGTKELEVSNDPFDAVPLSIKHELPVFVSMTKIGQCFIVDATAEEESCMAGRVTAAVDSEGNICGINKTGAGGTTRETLADMLQCAQRVGKELNQTLFTLLKAEE